MLHSYETSSQALTDLEKRGFTYDFNLLENAIECKEKQKFYQPEEFNVVELYRFEGMSSTDDNSVIYAIETEDGLRGTLLDAYGVYAQAIAPELLAKLNIPRAED